jgi:hypothetical protein
MAASITTVRRIEKALLVFIFFATLILVLAIIRDVIVLKNSPTGECRDYYTITVKDPCRPRSVQH